MIVWGDYLAREESTNETPRPAPFGAEVRGDITPVSNDNKVGFGSGSRRGIRLSVEPLERVLADNNIDVEFIEDRLNAAIRKARFNGFYTLAIADEIACDILLMHPLEIWGNEYTDAAWADGDDLQDTDLEVGMADVKVRRRVA